MADDEAMGAEYSMESFITMLLLSDEFRNIHKESMHDNILSRMQENSESEAAEVAMRIILSTKAIAGDLAQRGLFRAAMYAVIKQTQ